VFGNNLVRSIEAGHVFPYMATLLRHVCATAV
jgi:hypothetical protein